MSTADVALVGAPSCSTERRPVPHRRTRLATYPARRVPDRRRRASSPPAGANRGAAPQRESASPSPTSPRSTSPKHDGRPETTTKLRWLLTKSTAAFGSTPLTEVDERDIAAWRMTLPAGHRFEATHALRQTLARAVEWDPIDTAPGPRQPRPRHRTARRLRRRLPRCGCWWTSRGRRNCKVSAARATAGLDAEMTRMRAPASPITCAACSGVYVGSVRALGRPRLRRSSVWRGVARRRSAGTSCSPAAPIASTWRRPRAPSRRMTC